MVLLFVSALGPLGRGAAEAAPPSEPAAGRGAKALAEGIRAYEELETEAARRALERAVSARDLGPEARARAHLYLGLLAFERGDRVGAERAFGAALRLDPAVSAPAGTSPKTTTLIAEVRKELEAADTPAVDAAPTVEVAEEGAERSRRELTEEERDEGVLAAGSDRGDTRVEAAALPDPASARAPPPVVAEAPRDDDEGAPWGWIALGAGAAAVAAGIAAVLLVNAGQDECGAQGGAGGCVVFTLR